MTISRGADDPPRVPLSRSPESGAGGCTGILVWFHRDDARRASAARRVPARAVDPAQRRTAPPSRRLGCARGRGRRAHDSPLGRIQHRPIPSPVLLGNELGITVAVTNCQYTYTGTDFGFQSGKCRRRPTTGRITPADLAKRDDQYLHVGLDYARGPLVALARGHRRREGRTWSLYPVGTQMRIDALRNTNPESSRPATSSTGH